MGNLNDASSGLWEGGRRLCLLGEDVNSENEKLKYTCKKLSNITALTCFSSLVFRIVADGSRILAINSE